VEKAQSNGPLMFVIDHGNGQVKAKSSKREIVAKSAYAKASAVGVDSYGDGKDEVATFVSNIDRDKEYVWGTGVVDAVDHKDLQDSYTLQDRYSQKEYQLLTDFILAELAADFDEDVISVHVITGIPSEEHGTSAQQSLEKVFNGSVHTVRRNGKDHIIKVEKVTVLPQSAGALFVSIYEDRRAELAQSYVGVIDIGSGTAVGDGYNRLKRQPNDVFTMREGMNDVYSAVRRKLIADNPNIRATVRSIEKTVTDPNYNGKYVQTSKIGADISHILDDAINEYADRLASYITSEWPDRTKFETILVAGGGAALVGKALAKRLDVDVLTDPALANLRGFYTFGYRKATNPPSKAK
jgi:plasmid segregation protein ParM